MNYLSDDELRTENPWQVGESVGAPRSDMPLNAGYCKGSKDGSGPRANGDRPLGVTAVPRPNRDEVTPYG